MGSLRNEQCTTLRDVRDERSCALSIVFDAFLLLHFWNANGK